MLQILSFICFLLHNVLIACSQVELQELVDQLHGLAREFGMQINTKKTQSY